MVLPAAEDVLTLDISRVDTDENNALNKIGDTAEYTFTYTFEDSLIGSNAENGWWVTGPYDLILTIGGDCGHTWNNALDSCTNE